MGKVHPFFASEDYGFMMEITGMAAVQIRQVKVWVSLQSMIGEMEQRLKRTTASLINLENRIMIR